MKKIILAANSSWYLLNFRSSSIIKLINSGYKVICLAPFDSHTEALKNLGCEWVEIKMNSQGVNLFQDLKLLLSLVRFYRSEKPLAIFHFTLKLNIYGAWASRLSQSKCINNISGLGTAFIHPNIVSLLIKILYKLSQCFAHKIFCQNIEDFNLLVEQRLVPVDRLELLPGSGVNLKKFHPKLKQARPADEVPIFLYVGRMLADKGLRELIEAISSLNQKDIICKLVLCGYTNNANHSNISIRELNDWSELPGISWIGPSEDVPSVMANVDTVVLPSYREGMPRSILEACAMGLPAIVTNVPGCSNIIQDNINGFLCRPKDMDSLKNVLQKMINLHPTKRVAMGAAGRDIVEKGFNEEFVVQKLIDVINLIELSRSSS